MSLFFCHKNYICPYMAIKYKRLLLKLSGESLMGDKPFGISQERLEHYAVEIKSIMELSDMVVSYCLHIAKQPYPRLLL